MGLPEAVNLKARRGSRTAYVILHGQNGALRRLVPRFWWTVSENAGWSVCGQWLALLSQCHMGSYFKHLTLRACESIGIFPTFVLLAGRPKAQLHESTAERLLVQ